MSVTREELEAVLRGQSEASSRGDVEALGSFASSHMMSVMANSAALMQMEVTELLQALSAEEQMLLEMLSEFEEVETPVNGDTAGWFGCRTQDFGEDQGGAQIEYAFLRFAREGGTWKLDGIATNQMPKGDLAGVTYADLEHTIQPEMRVDGVVHAAEAPMADVEVGGAIQMDSTGFRIDVVVNGTETVTSQDRSEMKRLASLKNGENVLQITAEPLEETPWAPEVKVAKVPEGEGYPQEVFSWTGERGQAASTEQRFEI